MTSVAIPQSSRYKDSTAALINDTVGLFPWNLPFEFLTPTPDWSKHLVVEREVGFPDIIAVTYFGNAMESLWWAVCLPNGIVNPLEDMYPGQVLYVPPSSLVRSFISRGPQ